MCGIIGGNLYDETGIKLGLEKTIHRGRDDSSYYQTDGFYIGHNRLSIQDLSSSANQPFWNTNKDVSIIYNGELWDSQYTKDLRNKITTPFRTTSDTEIILNAYLEFGPDCFNMLDGMFSFCIMDKRINKVYLVRDGFGELPFWYYIEKKSGKIAFCSEKKGLPLGDIFEKQVKSIQPGTFLEYDYITSKNSLHTFYTLPTDLINDDRETIIKNIRKGIEEAVKVKMISDVPICTILSGGLDSTIITYILSKINPNIEAFVFSVGEGDTKNDDIKYARLAAKEFGIKLHEIIITEQDILDSIDESLYVIEQTRWTNIGTSIGQVALSKKINELGYKVVFSGEMADEIFGSYGDVQAFYYTEESFDKKRKQLVKNVHKTNLICANQSILWGGTVEVRAPFCWRPFIEYNVNVPPLYRNEGGNTKPLLREAFRGEISDEILYRPKVTFHKGARTTDLIKSIKDSFKERLEKQFQYKNNNIINKFFKIC